MLTQGVLCRRYAGLAEAQAAWAVQVQAQQTWLMQLQAQSKLLQAHSAPPVSLRTWFDPCLAPIPCENLKGVQGLLDFALMMQLI